MFGLPVPQQIIETKGTPVRYWGCRAIDQDGTLDIVHDRITYNAPESDKALPLAEWQAIPFIWWVNTVALPELRHRLPSLPPEQVVPVCDRGPFFLLARRAGGYVYNGINPLLLELHRLDHDLGSRWYATFRQWADLGCQVMRRPEHVEPGRWGCRIVFYRPVTKRHVDPATGDESEDRFFVMRQWTVFNADQVEGADEWQTGDDDVNVTVPDYEPADELIAATGADIRHHGDRAFYKRPIGPWPDHHDGDFIIVPHKHRFDPVGSYYETVLHELGHWSELRLGWDHKEHGYAMGELVAEMASSFLATELGVPQGETLENHAAYLKSWLKDMKDDPAFIFKASTQASKVCDYLLAFTTQEAVAA